MDQTVHSTKTLVSVTSGSGLCRGTRLSPPDESITIKLMVRRDMTPGRVCLSEVPVQRVRRHGADVFVSELRGCRSCFAARDGEPRPTAGHCGTARPLHAEAIARRAIASLPMVHDNRSLYSERLSRRGWACSSSVVGFAISTVFWYYEMPIPAYLVLVVSMLLDLLMYYKVPDVTICYRCLCQLRGDGSNPDGRYRAVRPGLRRTVPARADPRRAVARTWGTGGVKEAVTPWWHGWIAGRRGPAAGWARCSVPDAARPQLR